MKITITKKMVLQACCEVASASVNHCVKLSGKRRDVSSPSFLAFQSVATVSLRDDEPMTFDSSPGWSECLVPSKTRTCKKSRAENTDSDPLTLKLVGCKREVQSMTESCQLRV